MIDELQVQDIALIREASLIPSAGLTVITGETGAGKTALLSALKLLCGERADSTMVREGASLLLVQARLYPRMVKADEQEPAGKEAASSDVGKLDAGEKDATSGEAYSAFDRSLLVDMHEGVVAQRSVSLDGRSRVSIAGRMAQVGDLAATVGATIDLCGQHEHQRLMRAANHGGLLDAWARRSIEAAQIEYCQAFNRAQEIAQEIEDIKAAGQLDQAQVEQARFTLRRIDEIAPEAGEYERLQAEVPLIENAEGLKSAVEGAHSALAAEGGALDAIGSAASMIESVASLNGKLETAAATLREAGYIVEDVARDVRSFADEVEYNPAALEQLQQRLGDLQMLMRSWGPTIDEVFETRRQAQTTVESVEGFEEKLSEALQRQHVAEEELAQAAQALHDARCAAAPSFEEVVAQQMVRLQLDSAALVCDIEMRPRSEWNQEGPDAIQFLFRPGSGLSARPLTKIASGGEISRVMLAIKVALGSIDAVDTLVFDEVDAGVGGTAARALADVLVDLAATHQVIVVTHLPQVAVVADVHYVALKTEEPNPETTFEQVEGNRRERELARMLSGDEGAASLEHARKLIEEAKAVKATGSGMHQATVF